MEATHTMVVEIITPELEPYRKEAAFVVVRATDGELGVLPNHAPLIASLDIAPIRLQSSDGQEQLVAVFGGFMEVDNNVVSIVTPDYELSDTIDVDRAERARKRAEKRLAERQEHIDMMRAQAALRRAMTRLQVSGKIEL